MSSDLDVVLRAHAIDSLVLTGIATSAVVLHTLCQANDLDFDLTGIATSAVVLHTLCQANDLDFDLTVLADACLDTDSEVHRFLTEKLFPQWADVVTVDDWLALSGS